MSERIRVLIADDSAFMQRAVERMLSPAPEIEVIGVASTGTEAVEMAVRLRPDVVILDVNMPELDGIEALRRIMADAPAGVVMLSTLTRDGARTTLRALDLGAVDFVDKTSAGGAMDIYSLGPVLREKVLVAAGAAVRPAEPDATEPDDLAQRESRLPAALRDAAAGCPYEVVLIGASTGGPRALAELVSAFPAGFGATVIIAQHMPAGFTQTLAERLNRKCELDVSEVRRNRKIEPGKVLLAAGGSQARLDRVGTGLVLRISDSHAEMLHRPSVDLLFRSAAEAVGASAIAVVLTGMGDDGALGLRALRKAGARTIAESEDTAIIYGMPKAAAPAAEAILPLEKIGPTIVSLCAGSRTTRKANP
jgi:two-component system chemotaxis response regulator CheB